MHSEDRNRFRQRTKWEMKVVKRRQQVLRPFKTMVKRLVLQKQMKKREEDKV